MTPIAVTILCTLLGASGVFSLVIFLIKRHDDKVDKNDLWREEYREEVREIHELLVELKEQGDKNEKDNVRTQLLLLIADYPDDVSEMLSCAEHYFKDLNGNWYLTSIFAKYLETRGIASPDWLLGGNE